MDNDLNNSVPTDRAAASTHEFEVLDRMQAAGEKISVRKFREKLGGGSMDRVAKILRQWQESRLTPPPPVPGNLGAGLAAVSQNLWNQALESARIQVSQELADLRHRVATLEGAAIAAETQSEEARDRANEARALAAAESTARHAVEDHLATQHAELLTERQALGEAQRNLQAAKSHIQDLERKAAEAEETACLKNADHLRALHELESELAATAAREAEVRAELGHLRQILNETSRHFEKSLSQFDQQATGLRELRTGVQQSFTLLTHHMEKQSALEAELNESRIANRALRDQVAQSQATIEVLTTRILSDMASLGGRLTDLQVTVSTTAVETAQAAAERHTDIVQRLPVLTPSTPRND